MPPESGITAASSILSNLSSGGSHSSSDARKAYWLICCCKHTCAMSQNGCDLTSCLAACPTLMRRLYYSAPFPFTGICNVDENNTSVVVWFPCIGTVSCGISFPCMFNGVQQRHRLLVRRIKLSRKEKPHFNGTFDMIQNVATPIQH